MRRTTRLLSTASALSLSIVLAIACGGSAVIPSGGDGGALDGSVTTLDATAQDSAADSPSSKDGGADASDFDVYLGPPVAVRFNNCGTFDACGGDPNGTFTVSDICVDTDAVLQQAKEQCVNIGASNWSGSGAGGLTVAGTNWASMTQTKISVDIVVPSECKMGFNCGLLAAALKQRGFDTASCKDNPTQGCDCSVSTSFDETSNGAFTQSGARITASNNTSYDYCRSGKIVTLNPRQDSGGPAPIYYTYGE